MSEVDESKFPYGYVPEHLKERVKNWRSLRSVSGSILTRELSEAAWAKIGVVRDPSKPMDKTIRKIPRSEWWVYRFRSSLRGAGVFSSMNPSRRCSQASSKSSPETC